MSAVMAVNIEPAGELLRSLREIGLRLSLSDEGVIKASPRDRVTLEIRSRIQALRDGLMFHLESERKAAELLERRVNAMGQRWEYSPEDLEEAQLEARRDPDGWVGLCEEDERSARRARQAGVAWPP